MAYKWSKQLAEAMSRLPTVHGVHVGLDSNVPVWRDHFHKDSLDELVHVTTGEARIETQKGSFAVSKGDTFLLPANTMHRDACHPGQDYTATYAFFNWPAGRRLLPGAMLVPREMPHAVWGHLHWVIEHELPQACQSQSAGSAARARILLMEVLSCILMRDICRQMDRDEAPKELATWRRHQDTVRRAYEYLLANYGKLLSLDEVADAQEISPFSLSHIFTREFGVPMMQALTAIRIDKAKEMLAAGEMMVKQVARAVGFADANYFSKVFRQHVGMSPTQFQSRSRDPRQ